MRSASGVVVSRSGYVLRPTHNVLTGHYHDTISHMMQNIEFSEEELFETICEEGALQGIADEPAYFDLVDEIIEDLRRESELGDDQNLQAHADHVKSRFVEYQARIAD